MRIGETKKVTADNIVDLILMRHGRKGSPIQSELRRRIETLSENEYFHVEDSNYMQTNNMVNQVRRKRPSREYVVRGTDSGFNIIRLKDKVDGN